MENEDIELPTFYVVNRELPIEHAPFIATALKITPIDCALVSDLADVTLALTLTDSLVRTHSYEEAYKLASEIAGSGGRPVVIGLADVLDAVYPDGRKEPVAVTC